MCNEVYENPKLENGAPFEDETPQRKRRKFTTTVIGTWDPQRQTWNRSERTEADND